MKEKWRQCIWDLQSYNFLIVRVLDSSILGMVGNSVFFFFPLQGPFYWIAGIVQVIRRLD